MPNETSRRYLFVAIDRATRWVFLHTCANMTDRFNGRISALVRQTYFANAAELETTLQHYLKLYNHHIPQRAIGSKTPIESLKHWQGLRPGIFVKRVYDHAGLDRLHIRWRHQHRHYADRTTPEQRLSNRCQ